MTIPNTFADKTISVSLEDLDNNFSYIESAIAALSTLSTLNVQTTLTVANTIVISQTSINNVQTINVATINVSNGVTISNNITISNNLRTSNVLISNSLNVSNTIIISNGIINVSNSIVTTNLITSNITARDIQFINSTANTVQANGLIEFENNTFYGIADNTQRPGFIGVVQFSDILTSNIYSAAGSSPSDCFPNRQLTLTANTIYEINYSLYSNTSVATGTGNYYLQFDQSPQIVSCSGYGAHGMSVGSSFGGTVTGVSIRPQSNPVFAPTITISSSTAGTERYHELKVFILTHATNPTNWRITFAGGTGGMNVYRGSYYKATRLPRTPVGNFRT
jgi:hypothetical protein